ncbi:phage holin family protein [Candidatus Gottesmanbacteria bacterium]|nr:phage holin family protein [Candidatus Gottesmanbacteria bacterium]
MRKQALVLAMILMSGLGSISSIGKVLAQTRETNGQVLGYISDRRVDKLEEFLTKNGSPLAPMASVFVVASDIYQFDWRLLPAISGKESSYGKKIPWDKVNDRHSFNPFGWGIYGDQIISFDSWEDGILKVASGLRREYFDKELLTTELVMRKFTPRSDGSWARDVQIIMENISPDGIPVGTRLGIDGFEENRREVKNNMFTAFLAQGAITTAPSTGVATGTVKVITDLAVAFSTWYMMAIAILLALDIILGIAAAIAGKNFNFNNVAAFMRTGVLPYLFGFAVVEMVASQFAQWGQIAITVIFVAIVLNLLGSIISNLAKLGVNMPTVLKKGK